MTDRPAPKPKRDGYTLEVTVTTDDGVTVPITIDIKYPPNMGAYAADALSMLGQAKGGMLMDLIQRLDASALERGRAAGIFDDTDLGHMTDQENKA